tara:strand:+ start:625 stop:2649 length:2025 start_codon:yes stop_codon:yes gene_type:complete
MASKSKQDLENQKAYNKELAKTRQLEAENAKAQEERKVTAEKERQAQLDAQQIQDLQEIRGLIQGNITEITSGNKARVDGVKASRQLQSVSEQLLSDARDETVLNEKQLSQAVDKITFARENLALDAENKTLTEDQRKNFQNTLEESEALLQVAKDRLKFEKGITEAQGLSGGITGGLQGILDKQGAGKLSKSLGIDDAVDKSKEYTKNLLKGGAKAGDLGTKFKVATNLVGNLGKNLMKSLGPVFLISELINGIIRADDETTKLGKSMSMTKSESAAFRSNLEAAANDSGNMAVTGTKLVENFTALNQQLGFINNFSTDSLVTMTKLTEQVKLSKEAAGGLVTLSEARGTNAERDYKATLGASYELQRQSGIQQDLKGIIEKVASTSGQLRANLGANTVEIAKAVTLAGELGGELSDVQTISKSILNFEDSIAKELEAELLTGKELNLEKARQAALTGDIVGLEREIADQLGTFTEFSKMNVIQQEATAAAFGLSSDKLSDMLFKQQVMGRSAKELRAAGEDDLARMLEQQSASDKMAQTVEKLQAVMTNLGTAFMPVIEVLGLALSLVGLLVGVVTDLLALFKGDFDFSATLASASSLSDQFSTFGSGNSGASASSEGSRPGQSRSGNSSGGSSRTDELLEKLLAKDTNLYMNDSKLNDAMNTSNVTYAMGS